ncbi:putative phage terminase, large subunit [Escherichia coli]|uniref:Putative phage terminase, large subunit n=60 Tax=Escherichia coli TaxID=562 RepID=A0A377CYJ0_ECOLX|nr:putative phage terminase, large subunit [Escherichia coli]
MRRREKWAEPYPAECVLDPGGGCADNAKNENLRWRSCPGKNKTASAIAAGYSAKTARVKGSQLAKDPEVLAFIARKQCETVEVDEVPVYRQKKSEQEDKPRRREAAAIPQPDENNPEMPPSAVMSPGIEYMEDGLPDPVKAMGRILVENLCIDPKLALDAAWRLAQFTHHKKGDTGKKSAKGDAAKKAANRFAVPPPPRLVVNNDNEGQRMIPVWSTACPDWAERLKKGLSIIPDPIYPDEAAHALAIFKQLRIVDAPGSPTFGESCAPWVFDLVAALFGSYDAQTGVRHIKEVFILIPKKNSKSTLAAGIMMTALLLNWRQAAGYTILAPTVEVAANAFNPARDMVRRDDDLDDLCQVQTHIRTITHRVTDTTLKVVAADPNTVSGIKSVGTLIDELWLFGKQYKAEDMLREAIGGLASRPEGFVVYTTTQSNEPPAGVFRQKLQYARDVRDGKIHDPHFLPVIFEHPPEMVESGAHLLMENLAMVNPNLGYSVDEAFLYREYRKAREAGEEAFRGFMSKHANVEIGLALRSDRWAGADFWEQQGRRISLDDILQRADVVTVGIDGGGLDDLLGMYVIGRDRETREWLGWGHAWAHETAVVRRKSEASRFQDFVACGDMTIVRRVGDDTAEVAEYVRRIHEAELLEHIGIDPSGVGQILDSLAEAGIPDGIVVGISQGWKLGGAIKTTERKTG